jgi:signal transduction histidine kinase
VATDPVSALLAERHSPAQDSSAGEPGDRGSGDGETDVKARRAAPTGAIFDGTTPGGARLDAAGLDGAGAPGAADRSGSRPGIGNAARRIAAGLVLPFAAVALAAASLLVPVNGGISGPAAVTATLIVAWALCGSVTAWARQATPLWQQAAGAAAAGAALGAGRLAARFSGEAAAHGAHNSRQLALAVSTLSAALMVAVSVHLLLALPDGRLASGGRRAGTGLGYATALVAGAVLATGGHVLPAWAGILAWSAALLVALPAARLRYDKSAGRDRERLQWAAIGMAAACTLALSVAVLSLLVGWPAQAAAVVEACLLLVPAGMAAGNAPKLGPHGGRLLVQVLAVAGFAITAAAIYLVVILGLGRPPADSSDQRLLGLSMVAAAVAAAIFAPARERLTDWATRHVFGARQAPDEVLRTFGSRMTRAIAMDELLLQLAESLRKTMALTSADIYTGLGDVLERTAAVPDTGPRPLIVEDRARPVVARAGVSGHAWASVWLPSLVSDSGGEAGQLRVAPVSHGGELLGLIVVRRTATADPFTAEDDRVLTELARQVGLALHNARLDTALQTTLDELRKQADELRRSRSRIVASADAERRRVERDLHDGAQQHLVALAVNLRLTRDLVTDDPETAALMLDQLADEVKATIQELRDLAHGIYPPLLADSGLGEALRAAGRRSALPVTVSAAGIGRYRLEIESAIYFCCLEALQNAAKHAAGASAEVRLWEESGGLLFSVCDDGPGFDVAAARGGHGYINMADRLGAIGGTVRWDSAPGAGTRITGSVPLL